MAEPLVGWCKKRLESDFGLDVSEDIVQYILSIESIEEIEEYVGDLVQGTDGKKRQFLDELIERWKRSRQPSPMESVQLYRKRDEVTEPLKVGDQSKKLRRKGRNKQETLVFSEQEPAAEEVKTPIDLAKAQEAPSSSSKKKAKFVNLYTKEGQDRLTVLIPGRYPCECLAQKHKLVNNCLSCGRIICEQEGSGPCFFCGTLVCTREEQEILQRDSNKSHKLLKKLMSGNEKPGSSDSSSRELLPHQEARIKAGLEKALEHKDKLLDFDRTSVRRTQVIDDEADYFAVDSNQWLSKSQREALRKKEEELREIRHANRLARKITIDFAGRQVIEEQDDLSDYYSKLDETVQALSSGNLNKLERDAVFKPQEGLRKLVNPNIIQAAPVWVDQSSLAMQRKGMGSRSGELGENPDPERSRLRIQDRELQEISDEGWCLSMHQPWASLLIKGIKKVEGRTWYSSHRGRLWIAAAARRPSPQEISEVEVGYRILLQKGVEFPMDYPVGCLLGCVNLQDCLSQEQYREQVPEGVQESGSPFVFICANPQELIIKFPVKGKHKIWKLDSKIHQGARKGLMRQTQLV
ncbi:activating signal cointegrator 1 [Latimeria chalumnae]|uniref:Activating signal cointegrator 1 n=1 Tax=Latimeria chalumnae TaxID=7897 RepID=H3B4P6_LATCH|nr:PREDICTED: activating signal cointegrator 1 [Latimeria chalumnae]|eukprot:XP_005994154.1 PREDICTED: activating signal cointegrator 1 [Latimeria chalumnae]